ncbi:hypothetical protein DL96DRAFT_1826435 [Flagelloscypha sp. PMI_526]|nr:hypothetical protein DL96DRAFT_1826435 [Flagelloscypha sp. PMI_526]
MTLNNKTENMFTESACRPFGKPVHQGQGGSKQAHDHFSLPPARSSSNSKPGRSPTIVELYSLPLPFPSGGLEQHTLMIGGGGVQPLALGIDLRLVLSKQEEQVEENTALGRSWDRDECPSTLLRPGLPLPTARDLDEESRNSPEFSTTLDMARDCWAGLQTIRNRLAYFCRSFKITLKARVLESFCHFLSSYSPSVRFLL